MPPEGKGSGLLGCGTAKALMNILNCSVATQSTSNSSYCKASLHPLCITAVNCGACIPPVARHRKHGLLYSLSMTGTLGTSVGSSMLRLLFSDVLLGVCMLPEPIGSAHIVVVWLLQMNYT